ncbi:hypothetical protein SAMN05216262_12135 [Colwellia chukchiensis]|uniref:Uncharacterized protein n=1 Tax=Colwellia chukchiensis TaxID=641665 RepID=A0A1H7SY03_9GAMM|nr:hypothetical protein [Colwellia chukchiensis]SEL76844.1 hypothetical protein SAMN05216262_12135 [Colwellia chukchiensis]
MQQQEFSLIKRYFVGVIAISIWSLLLWQHFHQGVPVHYFLQRADMPALSNWWGALLLPVLAWLAMTRVEKRLFTGPAQSSSRVFKQILGGFVMALAYGAVLSLAFTQGNQALSSVMLPAILVFALFFKVYQAEYVFGLILGMCITFGAVLPTFFASLIALASALVYFLLRFIIRKIGHVLAASSKQSQNNSN